MRNTFVIFFLSLNITAQVIAQDRFHLIESDLNKLEQTETTLSSLVNISVIDVTLHEFLRGLAVSNSINLSVSPGLKKIVAVNFANVTVKSVLLFLAREHNLDIKIIGNIISIEEYDQNLNKPKLKREIKIDYFGPENLITIELQNDSLGEVAKQISKISGKNVLVSPGIENKRVSAYINRMPFETVLKNLGISNDLLVEKTDDGFYLFKELSKTEESLTSKGNKKTTNKPVDEYSIKVMGYNRIDISAIDANIGSLIRDVSGELKLNYFLLSKIDGTISIFANNISYETFLDAVLQGLDYTFKKDNNIYIIGSTKSKLETTTVHALQFRSVEKILEFIPVALKTGVEILEFQELNSLFLSGKGDKVAAVVNFLKEIDKPVPLITIEVIIVDVTSDKKIETGIEAGLSSTKTPQKTTGTVFPKVDLSLSTQSINSLINSFNGLGWINLGKVTPQFYLNLKALEENGNIDIRSTPKLATLNGHEASLVSGETKYYSEDQQSYYGSQNPVQSTIKKWVSIDANLSLIIKPIVSSDGQITLAVQLEQSEFTQSAAEAENGPPGKVNRKFTSLIRVKDEEIVLLGGLERNIIRKTASGVPFLSRIPIIKHLFSSASDSKSKSKLSIFIKPTIIK